MNKDVKGYIFKRAYFGRKSRHLRAEDPAEGIYYVAYMINRKRRTKCLDTTSLDVAKERWAAMKASLFIVTDEERYLRRQIEEGERAKAKLAQITHGGSSIRIVNAFDAYIASKRRRSGTKDRTIAGYRQQFKRFADWHPGQGHSTTLRDITSPLAEKYVADLEATSMNAHTINKHIGFLELMWKTLDHTWPNPWAGLHSQKQHHSTNYRRLTHDECVALFRNAAGELKTLILAGYSTGQRLGDIAMLRWDQVDGKAKTITVTPAKTDRRKSLTVTIPMTKQLCEYMTKAEGSGYVMPGIASKYKSDATQISKMTSALFAECKIKDDKNGKASFHSLRHTFASMLADSGASIQIQSALTAHTLPGVVSTYTHPDISVLRKWVDKAILPI